EKEHPNTFKLDKWKQFFQSFSVSRPVIPSREDGEESPGQSDTGPSASSRLRMTELVEGDGFFTSYQHPRDHRKLITFYGDNHPTYAGNVVKAMASARDGYREIVALFELEESNQEERDERWRELTSLLDDALIARVHQVNRLTPTIVEVVVRAPFAAQHFEPGQ